MGLTRFLAWFYRKDTMILCYHGVTEHPIRYPDDPDGLHARRNRFATQLDYLRRHYCILLLDEYINARRANHPLPDYSLIITFDDGWRNFLTVAVPELAERRIPVSLFLITGGMQLKSTLPEHWSPKDDQQILSWAEARTLQQKFGVEIGSHTCSHAELQTLALTEAEQELRNSQKDIIVHLGNAALPLAYPKGGYNAQIAESACMLGYTCGLTTDRGFNDGNTSLFMLRRQIVGDFDLPTFAAHVSGMVWWLDKTRTFFRRHRPPKTQLSPKTA